MEYLKALTSDQLIMDVRGGAILLTISPVADIISLVVTYEVNTSNASQLHTISKKLIEREKQARFPTNKRKKILWSHFEISLHYFCLHTSPVISMLTCIIYR